MLVEKPKTRAMVTAAVDEIHAAGVEPTVDDILWLAHLADMRCRPSKSDPLDDFAVPVRCGRADLYKLTVAGDVWLRECAYQWWPRSRHPHLTIMAEMYALANGRTPDAIRRVWNVRAARGIISLWAALHLPVSYEAIGRALALLSGSVGHVDVRDADIVKERDVSPVDWGEQIALLCAAYKQVPEVFEFQMSADQCMRLLKKSAYAMGRPDLAPKDDDADLAFGEFRLVVREIIRKGKAANG